MIRRLLILVAVGAIVSIACFSTLNVLGGFGTLFGRHAHHHGRFVFGDDGGPIVTRDLPWAGSETLHIDNSAAVITYIQGPTAKFTVTGPKSRIDRLGMSGDTLTGSDIRWDFSDNDDALIHMTITSPNTHAFFLSGEENLTLTNYDQDSLNLNVSGASRIKAVGRAKHATINISGAGRLDLAAMPVDDLKLDISGAGSATVDPKQSADISISGAGHVGLLTRPPILHSRISGIGSITTPDGKTEKQDKNDREDD
jgi:hypothetical protein